MTDKVIGCEKSGWKFFRCFVTGRKPLELCPYGPHGSDECQGHRDDFQMYEVIDAYDENDNRIHKRLPREQSE